MAGELIAGQKQTDIEVQTLQSQTRIIQRRLSDSGIITNILAKGLGDTKTTYKNLRKQSTEVQLRTLARISSEVSKALNIYQGFTNSGWSVVGESDRAEIAIKGWFDEQADRGVNINNLINENIYDLYVLGAMCMRTLLINDEPQLIRNIPPEEIDFIHQIDPDPANIDYGKIWYTGFYLEQGSNQFVVLESIIDPNPYFYYAPMTTTSKSPKGISIIESVIELAISAGEKDYMLTEYLRGSIFPHEIVSIILDPYFEVLADENVDFDIDAFNVIKKEAVDVVKKFMDESDSTQTLVTDVEIKKIVVGTLEGQNLRGLSEINNAHDLKFPRALKAPATLLGMHHESGALNDTFSRYDIRGLYKNILNIRETIRQGWEKLCTSYLAYRGIRGKGGIAFNDSDVELRQSITQAVQQEAEASKTLIDSRVFTRQEMREALVAGTLDLTALPPEMPAELEEEIEVANSQPEVETEETD